MRPPAVEFAFGKTCQFLGEDHAILAERDRGPGHRHRMAAVDIAEALSRRTGLHVQLDQLAASRRGRRHRYIEGVTGVGQPPRLDRRGVVTASHLTRQHRSTSAGIAEVELDGTAVKQA